MSVVSVVVLRVSVPLAKRVAAVHMSRGKNRIAPPRAGSVGEPYPDVRAEPVEVFAELPVEGAVEAPVPPLA